MKLELFHRLAEPESARMRALIVALGLKERIDFRNVAFDSDARALATVGGARTPALWDGARLHEGEGAIRVALAALPRVP